MVATDSGSGVTTVTIDAAVDSVNGLTGVVVLNTDDILDTSQTNKYTTAADITKLGGIETGADVTDAVNVAGALPNGISTLTSGEVTQLSNIGTNLISATEWGFVAAATAPFTSTLKIKIDGIETGATADQTAGEILTAIKTVDGAGSGLDADSLDGHSSTYFLTAASTAVESFALDVKDTRAAENLPDQIPLQQVTSEFTDKIVSGWHSVLNVKGWTNGYANWQLIGGATTSTHENLYFRSGINSTWNPLRTIWHSGNDGTGSGLDADTLDGIDSLGFSLSSHNHDATYLKLIGGALTGAITTSSTIDGRNVSVDGTKLDGIETNATADQTAGEIEAIVSHDNLLGFVTNEHLDWTTDQGATNIHLNNIPATALTTVQTSASEIAHLALTTEEGDVVVRTDENKTYMHNGGIAGTMADFTLLATPTDSVTSVNGATGAVVLTHDGFVDFVANEHIDWTIDQVATNVHVNNLTGVSLSGHTHVASNITDFTTASNVTIDARVTKGFVDALNVDADTLDGIDSLGFSLSSHNHDATYVNVSGDTMTNGLAFGASVVVSPQDLTRHLSLYGTIYGFSITNSTLNHVSGSVHDFYARTVKLARMDAAGTSSPNTVTVITREKGDARYLGLSGGALTGAITTSSTIDGRFVSADGTKLDGIETGATADQTAGEILTAIKTVDGAGSGLDADSLDGVQAEAMTWGHNDPHITYRDFNDFTLTGKFGAYFIQSTINGPGHPGAGQYYHQRLSLGSQYVNYSLQLAIARNMTDNYLYYRNEENGFFSSWYKMKAGDSDTLVGAAPAITSTGNTIVKRDGSGDIKARLFRSEYDITNSNIGYIMTQIDTVTNNYMRPSTPAQVKAALGIGASLPPKVTVFTVSGIYTKTAGAKLAEVKVTGGGASAGDTGSNSRAGGAGGTAIKMIDLTAVTTATITVGAGGAASLTIGNDGSASSYSDGTTILTGNGGTRGIAGSGGGTATGGDINIEGGGGGIQTGGSSYWGTGHNNSHTTSGAYGGGGCVFLGNSAGIATASGVVHITEYF
ncbi:MAG: hypothetical protein COA84_13185 [Robiginitomaculum sp.]|nr:MAG: hypothetical protein COA84_13185 [Robiginitomaculum sp.]